MSEPIKVGVVSLGCPKNQCDAELMLAKLDKAGFKLVPEAGLADVVIINTCGFIQSAKEEAIEEICEAINRKNDGINKKIIVTGCLAQRYQQQMDEEFPEIDAVLGIGRNQDIVEAVNRVMSGERIINFGKAEEHTMEGDRMLSTLPHYAYLRIADGCDNCCTYCAIPQIRGRFRSRTMENIIAEAEGLVKSGVKELILIAQDTTRYGEDLYGKLMLPELVNKLCELDVKWIRLLYCYPERMTDELIDVIAKQEKVCKYIDLPLQHCNAEILHDMNRTGDRASLTALIKKLREKIPGLTLRTTFITGFPGETEEQFTELAEFVKDIEFERLGCFFYSQEEGTPAALMPDQIDDEVKNHRAEIIMESQMNIMDRLGEKQVGGDITVLTEGFDRYAECWFGRSAMDAPDIDGKVFFSAETKPYYGEMVTVHVDEAIDGDLFGTRV